MTPTAKGVFAWVRRLREPYLFILSGLALLAALFLQAAGIIRLPYTTTFVALPCVGIMVGAMASGVRARRSAAVRRFYVGLAAGLGATVAYDVSRAFLQLTLPIDINAFRVHEIFGSLILNASDSTPMVHAVGWTYHYLNGLTFAVAYSVVAGRARWYWGVVWALALELATLFSYPPVFNVQFSAGFLVISFAGHSVYGAALGLLNSRLQDTEAPARQESGI